jgi:heavy metal translocating P-type ATPase
LTRERTTSASCRFCERPVTDSSDAEPAAFCSTGCRTLHEQLGDRPESGPTEAAETDATSPEQPADNSAGRGEPDSDLTRTFLQVEGMHRATAEAFLEAVAEDVAGVAEAEASYVTETVRVTFDPDQVTVAELCEALSTAGYVATPRERTTSVATVAADTSPGGRSADRGLFDTLEFRYVAGIVFGSFLLIPYAVVLYPAQVSSLLGGTGPGLFVGGTAEGLLILPLFLVLTSVVLYVTGAPLLRGAYVSLRMRQPTTELLVSLTVVAAYLYSVVAIVLGRFDVYFDLTIVVTVTVVGASFYETLVKRRATDRLSDLTVSQVGEATRYHDDGTTGTVDVADLEAGDRVLVREGERVPVDGVLDDGRCTVDESVVTGESLPVEKQAGDDLVGGSVVTGDGAVVRVREGATSSIDALTTAVWGLQSATHAVQQRGDALAGRTIGLVAAAAVVVGVAAPVLGYSPLAALLAVVVASPWALGLATPLTVGLSLEAARERGIVVFDETVFERLRAVDAVVFDKTGTLTTGEMTVLDADAPDDLLEAAAAIERRAAHPAADALVDAYGTTATRARPGADDVEQAASSDDDTPLAREVRTHPTGVEGVVDDSRVLVGNLELFTDQGWTVPESLADRVSTEQAAGRLPVVVGRDGAAEGLAVVGDDPRPGWTAALAALADQDVEVVVLTGDDARAAGEVREHAAVEAVFAEVPPEGKTAAVRRLAADGEVAMVGDGTNDAPALAAADLGIALGDGTALASDAADLAIVDDDLRTVAEAVAVARTARRRLHQNVWLAFTYNGLVVPLAAAAMFAPVVATGVALLTAGVLAANAARSFP